MDQEGSHGFIAKGSLPGNPAMAPHQSTEDRGKEAESDLPRDLNTLLSTWAVLALLKFSASPNGLLLLTRCARRPASTTPSELASRPKELSVDSVRG